MRKIHGENANEVALKVRNAYSETRRPPAWQVEYRPTTAKRSTGKWLEAPSPITCGDFEVCKVWYYYEQNITQCSLKGSPLE